jgi:hypothetical protein
MSCVNSSLQFVLVSSVFHVDLLTAHESDRRGGSAADALRQGDVAPTEFCEKQMMEATGVEHRRTVARDDARPETPFGHEWQLEITTT